MFALRVDAPSRLRVWQQAEFDGVLYLREQCAQPTSELACNDDYRGSQRSLLTARVRAGTHYLFTDGLEPSQQGAFSLRAERVPEPAAVSLASVCQAAGALPVRPGVVAVDTFYEPSLTAGRCGGEGAPEGVVAVDVTEPSRLRARLRDPELNAVLYVRDRCAEPQRELACEVQGRVDRRRTPGSPDPRGLDVEVPAGRHFVFVDGQSAADFGAAHLELDLVPLREQRARCEAAPVLRDGEVVEGRLTAGPDHFGASCGGEARGSERLYALRLARRSLVRLELDSSFDAVLHLRAECLRPESELECNDDAGHSRHSSLTGVLDAGHYVVVVDGFGPTALGPYRLSAQVSPAP